MIMKVIMKAHEGGWVKHTSVVSKNMTKNMAAEKDLPSAFVPTHPTHQHTRIMNNYISDI